MSINSITKLCFYDDVGLIGNAHKKVEHCEAADGQAHSSHLGVGDVISTVLY